MRSVATLMDLGDVAGNVKDGCHIAAMGGVWMVFVYGFAGLRDYGGELCFWPSFPEVFHCIRFNLIFKARRWRSMSARTRRLQLKTGSGLTIRHEDDEVELSPGTLPSNSPNGRRHTNRCCMQEERMTHLTLNLSSDQQARHPCIVRSTADTSGSEATPDSLPEWQPFVHRAAVEQHVPIPQHIVDDDDPVGREQLFRTQIVVHVILLVGVDEDEVIAALRVPAWSQLQGPYGRRFC